MENVAIKTGAIGQCNDTMALKRLLKFGCGRIAKVSRLAGRWRRLKVKDATRNLLKRISKFG